MQAKTLDYQQPDAYVEKRALPMERWSFQHDRPTNCWEVGDILDVVSNIEIRLEEAHQRLPVVALEWTTSQK